MRPNWITNDLDALGFLVDMLDDQDHDGAQQQFDKNYRHGGGFVPFLGAGFRFNPRSYALIYPGDPPMYPLASTQLRDERIFLYPHSWVVIVQPDGSFVASRMD